MSKPELTVLKIILPEEDSNPWCYILEARVLAIIHKVLTYIIGCQVITLLEINTYGNRAVGKTEKVWDTICECFPNLQVVQVQKKTVRRYYRKVTHQNLNQFEWVLIWNRDLEKTKNKICVRDSISLLK